MSGDKLMVRDNIIDVESDPRAEKIDSLERQVAKLRGELSDARHELTRVREDSNRALTSLRQQLSPLYRALQRVFGELDDAGVLDGATPAPIANAPSPPPTSDGGRVQAVWNAWKQKLNAPCGRIIDALLVHGEMNTTQLSVAAQMHKSNVSKAIQKLNEVSVINKNGGRFSLKQL